MRWRLALASASLTLLILIVFAAVIGNLATERVRSDFNRELRRAVTALAHKVTVVPGPTGRPTVSPTAGFLRAFAAPNGASVRVYDSAGTPLFASSSAMDLGPPNPGIHEVGSARVATARIISANPLEVAGYVQYGRDEQHIDSTIERLWLFIAAGVLGGTLLASLAGLALASRAMRPIASLTAASRSIAATRDPSQNMPQVRVDDEVGELARTLDDMLRSLDSARAERERAMQKQREFVADASHELRTPLTSVLANLELLQASLPQSEHADDREMVDSALRSSRRMSRLVADLLLLARADAGRISERTTCDLAEIAGNAAAEVAPVTGDRILKVDNSLPISVDGNPDELHRLVVNLLDNAVRHTPTGSTIELRLRQDREQGEVTIEVADDGPGVPPAMRDQVFDRFVRGTGPADTAAGPGTGLGLAIVRAVARSHGGEVEIAESEIGGALFRVHLPLAKSEEIVTPSLGTL